MTSSCACFEYFTVLFHLDDGFPYYFDTNGTLCNDCEKDEEDGDNNDLKISSKQYKSIMNSIQALVKYRMLILYNLECKVFSPSRVPVYITPNWRNTEKLLLVIQSNGELKPGIWSKKALINRGGGLKSGSMLPVFHRASREKYAIVVLNPNACWLPDYR